MIWKHRKTGLPGLYIFLNKPSKDSEAFTIRNLYDLPDFSYSEHLTIAPEIWENQGKTGLYALCTAFLGEENPDFKYGDVFWMMFLPSGFPDGVLPIK